MEKKQRTKEQLDKFRESVAHTVLYPRIENLSDEDLDEFLTERTIKQTAGKRKIKEEKEKQILFVKAHTLTTLSHSDLLSDTQFSAELQILTDDSKKDPSLAMLVTVHYLIREHAKTLEQIRNSRFPRFKEDVWDRFKKAYLKFITGSTEEFAHTSLMAKDAAIKEIKSQIEYMKLQQAEYPKMYAKEIIEASKLIADLETKAAMTMMDLGLIGEGKKKTQGTVINIINKIPRPVNDRALGGKRVSPTIDSIKIEIEESKQIATIEI